MKGTLLTCLVAMSCSEGEEALVQSESLSGQWTGEWIRSFSEEPPVIEALSLRIEDTFVVGGSIRGTDFSISDREVLFDERQNGVVYDEGERLFRTNFADTTLGSWSLGFLTDATGDRAVVSDFFVRVGAIQRSSITETPSTPPRLEGRWAGRFVALDNSNPDDAEIETGNLTLDCADLTCTATGDETFTLRFDAPDAAPWVGTVDGLIETDELLRVRAVTSPDGRMLAIGVCAVVFVPDLFCAYAALSR